jgi:hypothetical protein
MVHRFTRHDFDKRVSIVCETVFSDPEYAQYWPPERVAAVKKFYTRRDGGDAVVYDASVRQEAQVARALHMLGLKRNDVLLTNVNGRQYVACLAPHGGLTGKMDHFSADDIKWALEESARCWELALTDELYRDTYYPGVKLS